MSDTELAMPGEEPRLLDIQRRYREMGRLRMGEVRSGHPAKLDRWRVTSADRDLLVRVADLYGGVVEEWANRRVEGQHWQVKTQSDTLRIMVPPGVVLTQVYELWTAAGCQRRCGGAGTQYMRAVPCACPADKAERMALAQEGKACSPTTRLSVMLRGIPDIGVWRLESKGYYAASELPGTFDILRAASNAGALIPALLRIEHRTAKRANQGTRKFVVPALKIEHTIDELHEQLGEGAQAAVEAAARPALGSGPVPVEAKSMPGRAPAFSTDGGTDPGDVPAEPPDEVDPPSTDALPEWITTLRASDQQIIEIAREVAQERGANAWIETLGDVALQAKSDEARDEIRQRAEALGAVEPGEQERTL